MEYSLTLLKTLVDNAVDGIIVIDDRGIIQMVNPAVQKMFGYDKNELLGKSINMLMPERYSKKHDSYISNYLNTGIKHIIGIGREVEGKRADGSVFPFDLSISELILDQGQRLFAGTIHDISKQKEAQLKIEELNSLLEAKISERTDQLAKLINRLQQTNAALRNEILERKNIEEALRKSKDETLLLLESEKVLSELKSRFISTASHEFRTPLSSILSSAKLIGRYKEASEQEKRLKHIKRIETSVNNLNNILNDLLTWSKFEEKKITYKPVDFSIIEMVKEVIEEVEAFSKEGQIFEYVHQGDSDNIILDPVFIKNIMLNLISNAIKYSPEKSCIKIDTQIDENALKMLISDEGCGIPEEEQAHVFNRFFRAKNVDGIQGTGLGLNIVKKYLEAMNGDISFKSSLGKGSTFHVTIPLNLENNEHI